MQFSIHISVARGTTPAKFNVPSVRAVIAGVWSDPDKDILRPDRIALLDAIPARFRKALSRAGEMFWYSDSVSWNGTRMTGQTPYCTLYDARGKWLATIYAIPCAGGPPRKMLPGDIMSNSHAAAYWAHQINIK